jgi:hypothetical protein
LIKTFPKIKVAILISLMIVVGYVGFNTSLRGGLAFRFPEIVRNLIGILDYSDSAKWMEDSAPFVCHMPEKFDGKYQLTCKDVRRPLLAIWGDSHATYLTPGLMDIQKMHPFGLLRFSNPRCPPVLDVDEYLFRKECIEIQSYIFEELLLAKPDVLIIHFAYREPEYFWTPQYFSDKFFNTVKQLKQDLPKTRIIVIGPVPRWQPSPQAITLRQWIFQPDGHQNHLPIRQKAYELRYIDEILEANADKLDYIYLSPNALLCNEEGCVARVGEKYTDFIAVDYGHFSKAGSIYFAKLIRSTIFNALGN